MNQKQEHAFYISDPADLKYFYNSHFDRLYFGNEFCEFLIPTAEQLEDILLFIANSGVNFTFVTPPCSERAIAKCAALLESLPENTEVVFNDWGLLKYIVSLNKIPVHGRLLCHAKKDPRLKETPPQEEYSRGHNIQNAYIQLLIDNNTRRVEIDNVFQGLRFEADDRIRYSLYYPFVPCTATRKCYFANTAAGSLKFRTITECAVHCEGKNIALDNKGVTIYVKGNAQYYVNHKMSIEPEINSVDRFVYMPVFPNHNFTRDNILYLDWDRLFKKYSINELWGEQQDAYLIELKEQIWSKDPGTPRNVIDIGCGTGRHASLFENDNYHGIDISRHAVTHARNNEKGVFIHGDIMDLKGYTNYFDNAFDYGCFHTLPPYKRRQYFESLHGIIKSGGQLLLCAWTSEDSFLPVFFIADQIPEWACSDETLKEVTKGLFEITRRDVVPCTERNMLYAVLQKL